MKKETQSEPPVHEEARLEQLKKLFLERNKNINIVDISEDAIVALQHVAFNAFSELEKKSNIQHECKQPVQQEILKARHNTWDLSLHSLKMVQLLLYELLSFVKCFITRLFKQLKMWKNEIV